MGAEEGCLSCSLMETGQNPEASPEVRSWAMSAGKLYGFASRDFER